MIVNSMIKKSRYYPKTESIPGINSDYYSVDPNLIEFDSRDSFKLGGVTKEAINYVSVKSELEKVEYTIVLYGNLRLDTIHIRDYIFARGNRNGARYSLAQLERAVATREDNTGRVIYGHTHVSNNRDYNCFSVLDLKFILEKALKSGKDEYSLLITKDGYYCIKYSIKHKEFFRVRIS